MSRVITPPPLSLFQLMDGKILSYPMGHGDGSHNKKKHCSLFAQLRAHSLWRVLSCINIWDLASPWGDRDSNGLLGTRAQQMLTWPLTDDYGGLGYKREETMKRKCEIFKGWWRKWDGKSASLEGFFKKHRVGKQVGGIWKEEGWRQVTTRTQCCWVNRS